MTRPNDGGPAFPTVTDKVAVWKTKPEMIAPVQMGGMSLRDWFAGQALQGVLANGAHRNISSLIEADGQSGMSDEEIADATSYQVARLVGRIADAMLAERAKGGAE